VKYFNGRQFNKALLPMEDAYFASEKETRVFYQGLVQLIAAMLKITRWPDKSAALSLLKKSGEKLEKINPDNFEVELLMLMNDIKKLSDEISLMKGETLSQINPENLPFVRIKKE
jgi:predicted metal-dependent hydrolase